LYFQLVHAAHEVDAIEDVWFGDATVGTLDANGLVTDGPYYKSPILPVTETLTIASGALTLAHTPNTIISIYEQPSQISDGAAIPYTWGGGTSLSFDAAYDSKTVVVTYNYVLSAPYVKVKKYLGTTAGERDTDLEAVNSEWKTTHVGKGRARTHITCIYDMDLFPSGLPAVTVIIRGKKVYDPRLDTTAGGSGSHRTNDES